jgi:hypothetical protein
MPRSCQSVNRNEMPLARSDSGERASLRLRQLKKTKDFQSLSVTPWGWSGELIFWRHGWSARIDANGPEKANGGQFVTPRSRCPRMRPTCWPVSRRERSVGHQPARLVPWPPQRVAGHQGILGSSLGRLVPAEGFTDGTVTDGRAISRNLVEKSGQIVGFHHAGERRYHPGGCESPARCGLVQQSPISAGDSRYTKTVWGTTPAAT